MKKGIRSIRLSRETLRHLTASQLRGPRGAAAVASNPNSQEGDSCMQSCFFVTCNDTCPWPTQTGAALQAR